MKTKLTTAVFAALLLLVGSNGAGHALGFGGPDNGVMCVAMCSAAQYQRDMATMQELQARLAACDTDDECRDAAWAWAEAKWAESRRLWEACDKACEPGQ